MKVAKRPLYPIFIFSSFFSALFLRMTHCDLTDGQGRCKRSERRRGGGLLTAAEYKKWLSYVIRLRVELLWKEIASFSLQPFENHVSFGLESRRGLNGKMRPSLLWRKNVLLHVICIYCILRWWAYIHRGLIVGQGHKKTVKRPFPSKAFFGYVSKSEMIASTVGLLLE